MQGPYDEMDWDEQEAFEGEDSAQRGQACRGWHRWSDQEHAMLQRLVAQFGTQ